MRLLIGVSLLVFSAPARALEFGAFIVKIQSVPIGEEPFMTGSGVAFTHNQRKFVVTSDHVVLHENKGIEHKVFLGESIPATAKYLTSDWGFGLALLEITSPLIGLKPLKLAALAPYAIDAGHSVQVVGYPFSSMSWVLNNQAEVVATDRDMGFFAELKKMIEVKNAHAEFGMSGGATFTSDNKFVGILSHQIFDEYAKPELRNRVFLIPADVVHDWLTRYLVNPETFETTFIETAHLQMQDGKFQGIYSGILYFHYTPPEPKNYIRGGLTINFLGGTPWTRREYRDIGGFVEKIRARLAASKELLPDTDLIFLRYVRNRVAFDFSAHQPASLLSFFRQMDSDTRYEPVFSINEGRFNANFNRLKNTKLTRPPNQIPIGPTLGRAVGQLDDRLRIDDRSDGPQYGGYRWAVIKSSDIDFLINDPAFANDWATLKSNSPAYADKLIQELTTVRDILARLTI